MKRNPFLVNGWNRVGHRLTWYLTIIMPARAMVNEVKDDELSIEQ